MSAAHTTIRMVQRASSDTYRRVPESEYQRMRDADTVRFEGVDGDEDANTVTYWYNRDITER